MFSAGDAEVGMPCHGFGFRLLTHVLCSDLGVKDAASQSDLKVEICLGKPLVAECVFHVGGENFSIRYLLHLYMTGWLLQDQAVHGVFVLIRMLAVVPIGRQYELMSAPLRGNGLAIRRELSEN